MLRSGRLIFLAAVVLACGPSGGGPHGDDDDDDDGIDGGNAPVPGSLRIAPEDVILQVEGGLAKTQGYTALFRHEDGSDEDVTAEASFSVDDARLGGFAGSVFTSATDRGGRTVVRASARGKFAMAALTVHLTQTVVAPGAPADAADQFDGAAGGGVAPSLVYPPSGTIVPPNLNVLEFHFLPGAGNTLFELSFVGGASTINIYLVCQALAEGCGFEPDQATWDLIAGAERGGEPVFITLRGLSPAGAGASATSNMQFSADDLLGGIYYWDAGAGAIKRYDFGLRGQTAESYLTQAQAGASTCVGCHSISRDGSRIAVGLDIPAPSMVKVFDVATREAQWSAGSMFGGGGANFFTFSADSTQMISSNGASLVLRNAATGDPITDPLKTSGTMPDWSPDGARVVYARPDSPTPCPLPQFCGSPGIGAGNIEVMTAGVWTDSTTLVPSGGRNHYYPAFSPDGQWVLFNTSSTQDSFDAADAEVWVVSAAGGTPIRLAQASPPPGGDSWPKWAPFSHTYAGGQVFWLSYASRRDYGLRLKNSTAPADTRTAQIWMVGFDPARAAAGLDPSFAAFWLPFQDLGSGNHIAQWVERIDRQPCGNDEECASGEFCEGGVCLPYVE